MIKVTHVVKAGQFIADVLFTKKVICIPKFFLFSGFVLSLNVNVYAGNYKNQPGRKSVYLHAVSHVSALNLHQEEE